MDVTVIPALEDNYIYLLVAGHEAAVVDPAEAEPVLRELEQRRLKLTHILITHDHHDHVAGVPELQKKTGAQIITGGDAFHAAGAGFEILQTPGHTATHISFYSRDAGILFCGDTMFCAGCGRLFGLTPALMFNSLKKLAALPDDTKVYCGHEYTRDNLRFAASVEPENEDVARCLRELRTPSVPSTIGLEKKTNPFVRSRSVEEFAERRRRKDVFA
jgi:hydroxyacylglutathione hydrolase